MLAGHGWSSTEGNVDYWALEFVHSYRAWSRTQWQVQSRSASRHQPGLLDIRLWWICWVWVWVLAYTHPAQRPLGACTKCLANAVKHSCMSTSPRVSEDSPQSLLQAVLVWAWGVSIRRLGPASTLPQQTRPLHNLRFLLCSFSAFK